MFPGFRDRFGAALDLIVEFSTLGEYGLAASAAGSPSAPRTGSEQGPRLGGAGGDAARAAGRRNVVGGAVASGRGLVPSAPHPGAAATPAARRLGEERSPERGAQADRRSGEHRSMPLDRASTAAMFSAAGCREQRDAAGEIRRLALSAHSRRTGAPDGQVRPQAGARCRGGAPAAPEQLCLSV